MSTGHLLVFLGANITIAGTKRAKVFVGFLSSVFVSSVTHCPPPHLPHTLSLPLCLFNSGFLLFTRRVLSISNFRFSFSTCCCRVYVSASYALSFCRISSFTSSPPKFASRKQKSSPRCFGLIMTLTLVRLTVRSSLYRTLCWYARLSLSLTHTRSLSVTHAHTQSLSPSLNTPPRIVSGVWRRVVRGATASQ